MSNMNCRDRLFFQLLNDFSKFSATQQNQFIRFLRAFKDLSIWQQSDFMEKVKWRMKSNWISFSEQMHPGLEYHSEREQRRLQLERDEDKKQKQEFNEVEREKRQNKYIDDDEDFLGEATVESQHKERKKSPERRSSADFDYEMAKSVLAEPKIVGRGKYQWSDSDHETEYLQDRSGSPHIDDASIWATKSFNLSDDNDDPRVPVNYSKHEFLGSDDGEQYLEEHVGHHLEEESSSDPKGDRDEDPMEYSESGSGPQIRKTISGAYFGGAVDFCFVCRTTVPKGSWEKHANGKDHSLRSRVKNYLEKTNQLFPEFSNNIGNDGRKILTGTGKQMFCEVCRSVIAMPAWQAHKNGKDHKKRKKIKSELVKAGIWDGLKSDMNSISLYRNVTRQV